MYELLIIGAGPAGLTAGIYGARSGLKTAIIERGKVGGTLSEVPWIENYPGFENVSGVELLGRLETHARRYCEIMEFREVLGIENLGDSFRIRTTEGDHLSRAVILATGTSRRKLGVRGEKELFGRGVSYCPMCDGYMFRGKRVVVVGGGNTAAVDALFLKSLKCKVTMIHRRRALRAEMATVEKLKEEVDLVLNSVVEEILGTKSVEGIKVKNLANGTSRTIPADGVFISVGTVPNASLAKMVGASVDAEENVVVDKMQRTNVERFYAAGDVTGGVKQVIVACAEGAVAATSAFEDVKKPYWAKTSP